MLAPARLIAVGPVSGGPTTSRVKPSDSSNASWNGVGAAENFVCGDVMTVQVRIEDDTVVDACFDARGCEPTFVAGRAAVDVIRGRSLADAGTIDGDQVAAAAGGLPHLKMHCAILAAAAARRAIHDAESRSAVGARLSADGTPALSRQEER